MTETITVDRRFRGPAESGNGGYVCGRVASLVGGSARVTLRAPPPLDVPLAVEREGEVIRVLCEGRLVAEGEPAALSDPAPLAPPAWDEARVARKGFRGFVNHPFPTCFVCGPQRPEGDGMRIHPGWIGHVQVADGFVPDPSLDGGDGRMASEFVWSALDCPGAFALMGEGTEDITLVLGRMTARIDERPRIGEELVVTGWARGRDGRKHHCGTAVWSRGGKPFAFAHATWLALRE